MSADPVLRGDELPGTIEECHKDIEEALAQVADHSTLIFRSGSVNTFAAATLVIDRPLTLKGRDVQILRQ